MAKLPIYYKVLERYPSVIDWLKLLANLGRSPATVEAYGRGMAHYLGHCEVNGYKPEAATFELVTSYVSELLPGQAQAIANSTLHQRLTAIRLWYDHLVYAGVRDNNPVPRGSIGRSKRSENSAFARGLIPRLINLPSVLTDEQWLILLKYVACCSTRDRLMLSLAYCGALRRGELIKLDVSDLDLAHRLITIRAENTKNRRGRVVCYSSSIAPLLMSHLTDLRRAGWASGPLFRSVSDRNYGSQLSFWGWSKIVEGWRKCTDIANLSTHSFRHLRLTHLARSGWKLHEITSYAGHRDPKTTVMYVHLSGADLSLKMQSSIEQLDRQLLSGLAWE